MADLFGSIEPHTIEVRAVQRRNKLTIALAKERPAMDAYVDPAKTAVISLVRQLARQGLARWTTLGTGTIELTLFSGEVFHLDETSVTRVG
jgi:hypothetical protein